MSPAQREGRRIEVDNLLTSRTEREVRAMLADILAGDATAKGTLAGLREMKAIRDRA